MTKTFLGKDGQRCGTSVLVSFLLYDKQHGERDWEACDRCLQQRLESTSLQEARSDPEAVGPRLKTALNDVLPLARLHLKTP